MTDKHVVIGAGVITVLLVIAGALLSPAVDGGAAASSFSAAADGGKAAYDTLAALGYPVQRSYEPLASLRVDPASTVLIVTGTSEASEQDRRALSAFITNGGEVLLVGAHGAGLLGVRGATPARPIPRRPVLHRVLAPSPLAAGAPEITMDDDAGKPGFDPAFVVVFAVNEDVPLVTTARLGEGRVTWWAAPTPLVNAHIASAGNLALLLNVTGAPGARQLLWDEHYHGHTRSLWSYLVKTPLPWAGAQAALIAFAAVAAFSRRRGPVRPTWTDARTSPLEFIDVLGELYRRSGTGGAAIAAARSRLDRVVTTTGALPHDGSDEMFATAIANRTGDDARVVAALLAEARRTAADPDITLAAAVDVVARLQRLTDRTRGETSVERSR
jgi:hypothetical protein